MTRRPPADPPRSAGPYLLDTDTISDLLRRPAGPVAARIGSVGEERVFTSVVVEGELRYGANRSGSDRLVARVAGVLDHLVVEPLTPAVADVYGEIRAELTAAGTPIGPNDLWIAAHALHADATVVTANEREFRRVSGLAVENWIAT